MTTRRRSKKMSTSSILSPNSSTSIRGTLTETTASPHLFLARWLLRTRRLLFKRRQSQEWPGRQQPPQQRVPHSIRPHNNRSAAAIQWLLTILTSKCRRRCSRVRCHSLSQPSDPDIKLLSLKSSLKRTDLTKLYQKKFMQNLIQKRIQTLNRTQSTWCPIHQLAQP